MEEGNLFADDVRELNKGGVKGINAAFGEVFEEAAQGDEVIGLGDSFESLAVSVDLAIESEAIFAQ